MTKPSTVTPTPEGSEVSSLAKAVPALVVFVLAVAVRALLQFYGGEKVGDVSWITTFAAIAASWLGLGAGISQVLDKVRTVEKNTNGKSDAERTAIAKEAASHVIAQLVARDQGTGVPPVVALPLVVPSPDDTR
jgi:hypothetical protein